MVFVLLSRHSKKTKHRRRIEELQHDRDACYERQQQQQQQKQQIVVLRAESVIPLPDANNMGDPQKE